MNWWVGGWRSRVGVPLLFPGSRRYVISRNWIGIKVEVWRERYSSRSLGNKILGVI